MRLFLIALLLLAPRIVRAEWRDLKAGLDPTQTLAALGEPLFVNKSRGCEIWIYDRGGQVEFEKGRLAFWQQPRPDPAAPPKKI